MNESNKTCTYRCGKKIEFEKSPDEIVVRSLPHELGDTAMVTKEQVSSTSTKIQVSTADLEELMVRTRTSAPPHHAYYESESGSEFLITDRIFVTFKDALPDAQVDEFAGRYGLLKKQLIATENIYFR